MCAVTILLLLCITSFDSQSFLSSIILVFPDPDFHRQQNFPCVYIIGQGPLRESNLMGGLTNAFYPSLVQHPVYFVEFCWTASIKPFPNIIMGHLSSITQQYLEPLSCATHCIRCCTMVRLCLIFLKPSNKEAGEHLGKIWINVMSILMRARQDTVITQEHKEKIYNPSWKVWDHLGEEGWSKLRLEE